MNVCLKSRILLIPEGLKSEKTYMKAKKKIKDDCCKDVTFQNCV